MVMEQAENNAYVIALVKHFFIPARWDSFMQPAGQKLVIK